MTGLPDWLAWALRLPPDEQWQPPEMQRGDVLQEAEIVTAEGDRQPIVLLIRQQGTAANVSGYSRPINLPPGASLVFVLDINNED